MDSLDRRTFQRGALGALLSYSLLETLFECEVFADNEPAQIARWLSDVNQLGQDLKDEKLEQTVWQEKVEELFDGVSLQELLELVNFDRLTENLELRERGERSLRFEFRQIEGVPERLTFGRQIFALGKDRSVVPHGHNNMATAFLILRGRFHGRHYDRLEDEGDQMIIKPTIDDQFGPGDYSTISDYKDNVHWFKSLDEPAFIFNIHVLDVTPDSERRTGRVYIDPDGERISGGRIRARVLGYTEAHELYG